MHIELPAPIAAYFRATNERNIDARLEQFGEHARVNDEDREYVGRAAIRNWMEDGAIKYEFTVDVRGSQGTGGHIIVTGLVSGTFPGSPVLLRHTFTVSDTQISALEIEA